MTKRRQWSIAWRLAIALTVGITVVWLGAAAMAASTMGRSLNSTFDEALRQTAFRLLPLAISHGTNPILPTGALGEEEYLTYYVLDAQNTVVLKADDGPDELSVGAVPDGFSRVDGLPAFRHTNTYNGTAIVVVELNNHRAMVIASSIRALVWPLVALIPLMGFGILVVVRRAMRPVIALSSEVGQRGGRNLSPLDDRGQPTELLPIAQAVGSLLDRLRAALDAERAFAASSAHELRTPIAGALAQTQLLEQELAGAAGHNRIKGIEQALKKLSHLSERLLQLSRLGTGFAAAGKENDLLPALRLIVDDMNGTSGGARVRLTLHPEHRLVAPVDVDAFAIAARNLIENALLHGDPGEVVEVAVGPRALVRVSNSGPHLTAAVLDDLQKPFVRGPTSAGGTGLGLSIVRAIVDQSNGTLALRSPARDRTDGLEAQIAWASD